MYNKRSSSPQPHPQGNIIILTLPLCHNPDQPKGSGPRSLQLSILFSCIPRFITKLDFKHEILCSRPPGSGYPLDHLHKPICPRLQSDDSCAAAPFRSPMVQELGRVGREQPVPGQDWSSADSSTAGQAAATVYGASMAVSGPARAFRG
jgi:hypothetical protein